MGAASCSWRSAGRLLWASVFQPVEVALGVGGRPVQRAGPRRRRRSRRSRSRRSPWRPARPPGGSPGPRPPRSASTSRSAVGIGSPSRGRPRRAGRRSWVRRRPRRRRRRGASRAGPRSAPTRAAGMAASSAPRLRARRSSALSGAFQTEATGPLASRPPTRKIPSPETTTAASARGAGSFRSADSVQDVIFPVAASGVPAKTVSVGAPAASQAADHVGGAGEEDRGRAGPRRRERRALPSSRRCCRPRG